MRDDRKFYNAAMGRDISACPNRTHCATTFRGREQRFDIEGATNKFRVSNSKIKTCPIREQLRTYPPTAFAHPSLLVFQCLWFHLFQCHQLLHRREEEVGRTFDQSICRMIWTQTPIRLTGDLEGQGNMAIGSICGMKCPVFISIGTTENR